MFRSQQDGGFNDASTWTVFSGSDADNLPDADDDIIIQESHTITLYGSQEANTVTIFGTLSGAGPHELTIHGASLKLEPGGEIDLQGDLLEQGDVESVSVVGANEVTLSWASPPFDPTIVPIGSKLMYLDARLGDDECSREAWHMYDVVSTTANALTYSLGDVTNDVIGSQLNNVGTHILLTPPAGSFTVTIVATVPGADAYVGKYLELPSGNQYLIVETDNVANTLKLYQPIEPSDASQLMVPVAIHNGVRQGDQFVIFDPIRVRGAADSSEVYCTGPGRVTLRYAEFSHFRQITSLQGAVKIRNYDAAQPDQELDVSYVDFHHCNSNLNVRGAVEFISCRNFKVRRVNVHDPEPSSLRTAGLRFNACANAIMEESRFYRLRATGFDDGPFNTSTGMGNTIQRCVIHHVINFPLGGDAGDGINFNGSKQGRILDNLIMHTSHQGIVFHHAEQYPQIPDRAVDALIRGCVSLRHFDNAIVYNQGGTHPDRDVHALDCILGYSNDRNSVYMRSLRYSTSKNSHGYGDLGTPLNLGVIFAKNVQDACYVWEPTFPTLFKSCVFYDNTGTNIIQLVSTSVPELNVVENTFYGLETGSQRCVAVNQYPLVGGVISHNIFAQNGRGIFYTSSGANTMSNDWNLYHEMRIANVSDDLEGPNAETADPLFVDPNPPDLRLHSGSPALLDERRGAHWAGNIVRSWAMKVAGIDGEYHRDGKIFNDLDNDNITDFGNVAIVEAVARFDFGQAVSVVWPNSEFSLHIEHPASGKSIEAIVPVTVVDSQTYDVDEETFGMLYQYIDELGDVTMTLTHVGSDDNPGTGLAALFMTTFDAVPYSLGGPLPVLGDFDDDGDIDLADFSQFSLCFAGANVPPAASCPPGVDADLDNDGDVDLGDFAIFSLNYTGPL